MFKKKNEEEEEERDIRRFNRQSRNRVKASVGGTPKGSQSQEPKYDEEYYNNLIRQQQQQQLKTNSTLAGYEIIISY